MKTIPMVALAEHTYDAVKRQPGDQFEVEERHVVILEKLGRARQLTDLDAKPEPSKRSYKRRDMEAEK